MNINNEAKSIAPLLKMSEQLIWGKKIKEMDLNKYKRSVVREAIINKIMNSYYELVGTKLTGDPQFTGDTQFTEGTQLTGDPQFTEGTQLTGDPQFTGDIQFTGGPQFTGDQNIQQLLKQYFKIKQKNSTIKDFFVLPKYDYDKNTPYTPEYKRDIVTNLPDELFRILMQILNIMCNNGNDQTLPNKNLQSQINSAKNQGKREAEAALQSQISNAKNQAKREAEAALKSQISNAKNNKQEAESEYNILIDRMISLLNSTSFNKNSSISQLKMLKK